MVGHFTLSLSPRLALSQDFSLRQFAELALLQEPELVGMSQETRSEVSSEKAPVTSRCLGGFGPEAFVLRAALLRGARPFRVLHQTAWKLLCDASQAPGLLGALLLRFLPCFGHLGCVIFFEGISSRQSGLPCGKWGDPWTSRCQWHQTFVGVPGQFTPNHGSLQAGLRKLLFRCTDVLNRWAVSSRVATP